MMASKFPSVIFWRLQTHRSWKIKRNLFRNNLFFSIAPFDKLQEPNWDSIVHNVWQRKNRFHQNLSGCNRPDREQKWIWRNWKRTKGSQAIFENWQIIRRVTKLYNKRVSTCKFCFLFGEGGGGFKKNGLLNFTWERQNEFLARQV